MKLVITGNPGVGKHTITEHASKELQYSILDINKYALKLNEYEKSKETTDVDVDKLSKKIKKSIKENSIIIGHLAPYVLSKSQIDKVIILRKSPYKLVSIYEKRGYSRNKIFANLQSEILGIITYDAIKKFGKNKTFQINTTTKSLKKILNQIDDVLNGKTIDEKVDWLSDIVKKKDLKKFFPN